MDTKSQIVTDTNFLCPPYNKLLMNAVRRTSESQSEISSVDSDWSDIKSIAAQLGVSNPDDLLTERIKVDRQKLEDMITADSSSSEGVNSAESFFDEVMKLSSVYISWPYRLKIGAKTKRDPHVRIVGKPEDVQTAKEKILASLDSRGSRVIMKMDISYTDHSYIIGRGGNNIKRIMEETSTHIHFPDSNRSNPVEKSNHVSLCGSLEGVEKARSLVRSSTPLIISFELPIMAAGRPVPDNDTQYVKDVEAKYNIQVIFSTRPKLHSSLVLIKGSEKEAARVQEATQILIYFMCESIANQILVNLQLEISPQHHDIVRGRNNTQLLGIMDRTQTKIIFPDVNDVNIKLIRKSQITITGSIDGVYKARQQLIGNLPVTLIFDYPENTVSSTAMATLSNKYGVFMSSRHKSRQSTICIVIKGVEKFVDKMYEARQEILNLQTPLVKAEIPRTYFCDKDHDDELAYRRTLPSLLSNYPDSPLTPALAMLPTNNYASPSFGAFQKYTNPNSVNITKYPLAAAPNYTNRQRSDVVPKTSNYGNTLHPMNISGRDSTINSSGYQSISSSTQSLEQNYPSYGQMRPNSSFSQTYPDEPAEQFNIPDSRRLNESSGSSSQFDTEFRTPTYDVHRTTIFDFDPKKIEGYKAMERAPHGEIRTPNSNWIGLGLSKTSPAVDTFNDATGQQWTKDDRVFNVGATTSMLDTTPTNRRQQLNQHKDVHTLLTSIGLEHYIKTFVINEIDIDMLSTLTANNLTELGITAFGPRKKLLMAIRLLNAANFAKNHESPSSGKFSGSAAPGAERRTSNGW